MLKYKINKGFIVQNLGGRITIFDGEESVLYTFNETASFIFRRLKLKQDTNKIIEELSKKYKINPEKAKTDTREHLERLLEKKIILPA